MKRKAKLPFDPKAFLCESERGTSHRRIPEESNCLFRQGDPADAVFYIQTGKAKITVLSEQGKEAVVAVLGTGDFFGEGCLAGQALRLATVTALTECVIVRIVKGRHHARNPRRAGVRRIVYRASPGPQQSRRGGPGRSTVQFERETPGADPPAAREFWQGRHAGAGPSENQPRDAGGNDRHDAVARELFHEQISATGPDRLQRPTSKSTVHC